MRNFEFIHYDDPGFTYENPNLKDGATWKAVRWAFSADMLFEEENSDYWQPVTWLSRMLDMAWFGPEPGMHHLMNLAIHIVNTLLMFYVLCGMTRSATRSAVVAVLFAIHPLHVESVAWVTERKDMLSGLFWLLTIWAYARYAALLRAKPDAPAWSRWWRYVCVLVLHELGLMSKPMNVTLPCVLLLLDYWPLGRWRLESGWWMMDNGSSLDHRQSGVKQWRDFLRKGVPLILEKAPLLALSAISSLLIVGGLGKFLEQPSGWTMFQQVPVSYTTYLMRTVFPHNLTIAYPNPGQWPWPMVAGAVVVLGLISWVVLRTIRQRPHLFVGWCWFLVTLIPVINLNDIAGADRFTYMPLTGLFIMAAWEIPAWFAKERQLRVMLGILTIGVIVGLMVASMLQLCYWRNTRSLFERTLQIYPDHVIAHMLLGDLLKHTGKPAEAIPHYQRVLSTRPGVIEARVKLAGALAACDRTDEAMTEYRAVMFPAPEAAQAQFELAALLAKQGQTAEAIRFYRESLRRWPDRPETLNNLAWVLATDKDAKLRNGTVAVRLAERACRLTDYKDAASLDTLAAAYAETGRFDEAVKTAQKALLTATVPGDHQIVSEIRERLKRYRTAQSAADARGKTKPPRR
ncbi:MAG: tetratricopeptide repeat protein [Verrucomicrobia bacterium]|nr:tetratricopeptide repeat protein [Verrucomicrobiota bacterium]